MSFILIRTLESFSITFKKTSILNMEKNEILYDSFQIILSKQMVTNKQKVIYCEDDGEFRVYCNVCDKLCTEQFYKNHLKSQTHTNNIRKREHLIKSFQIISQY